MELLVTAALLALIIYGLERNRARQNPHPHPYLAGSTDIQNRYTERIQCELRSR